MLTTLMVFPLLSYVLLICFSLLRMLCTLVLTCSVSKLKMSLFIFFSHVQCLNANSVGDGVEQATLWKDEAFQ